MTTSIDAKMAQEAAAWFDNGPNRDALKKARRTAMRNLGRVAQGAEVIEQVDIVLQYQAARGVVDQKLGDLIRRELKRLGAEHGMAGVRSFLAHLVKLHAVLDLRSRR